MIPESDTPNLQSIFDGISKSKIENLQNIGKSENVKNNDMPKSIYEKQHEIAQNQTKIMPKTRNQIKNCENQISKPSVLQNTNSVKNGHNDGSNFYKIKNDNASISS